MEYVLASNNKGKIREMREIFGKVVTLDELSISNETIEDGRTFLDNALKKATEIMEITNRATIADDSGLCVYSLDNAPGVLSARYAGDGATDAENIRKLLEELGDNPMREAKFVCCIVVVSPVAAPVVVFGECEGEIAIEPRGNNGFGYDPVFIPKGYTDTFGELGAEIKNKISHRAKCLATLKEVLANGGKG